MRNFDSTQMIKGTGDMEEALSLLDTISDNPEVFEEKVKNTQKSN